MNANGGVPRLNIPGIGGGPGNGNDNNGISSDPFWDPSDMLPPPVSPMNRSASANASAVITGRPGNADSSANPNPFLDPDPFSAAKPSGLKKQNSTGALSWRSWRSGSGSEESGVRNVSFFFSFSDAPPR
jgi:hypothetical protein